MKIAVISDLHIGRRGLDFLDHSDYVFTSFLRNLEASYDKIILLGDVVETLMPTIPGGYEKAFKDAWNYRSAITSRFQRNQYEYIFGNHDYIAERLVGAKERMLVEHKDTKILFVHGHQLDKMYSKTIGNFVVYMSGLGVRAGLGGIYRKLATIEASRHRWDLRLNKEIKNLSEMAGASVLVSGHTHNGGVTKIGEGLVYLNSGHCAFGPIQFLSMDLDRSEYKLITC